MNPLLQQSWTRAWRGLLADGDGLALRDALLACHAQPHRHYHTQQHLEECLLHFQRLQAAPDRPAVVEMALWFHDAIHEPAAPDSETRSAAWAEQALLTAAVEPDTAGRVRNLVLATRHTALPASLDEKVLVDIDLAILGAQPARFAEYELQIRDEYALRAGPAVPPEARAGSAVVPGSPGDLPHAGPAPAA